MFSSVGISDSRSWPSIGHHHALGVLLELAREVEHGAGQHAFTDVPGGRVELAGHQARQVAVQGADRRRDRHVVVVQDHQDVEVVLDAGVVQRLEGHAGGHRAVADHGDRLAPLALQLGRVGHAQGRRDRGRRVRGAEGVVFAFVALREARQAEVLAQRGHALATAGQDLVRIGLVPDIPDDAVARGVEHVVQGDRQLDGAEVGRQVAAGPGHRVEQELAQFVGQRGQLGARQLAQVGWVVDGF
jgi:hypothetical protein